MNRETHRVNRRIRISPVRLIDSDGQQIGVVPTQEALTLAKDRGLDLVEISPRARPPVCKIMDYGKFKYEESKKAKEAKKKQHVIQMKEIKMRPKIEEHDFQFKMRHAKKFLSEHNKVKITMMFRGRELAHTEFGREILDRLAQEIEDTGVVELKPRMEGKNMVMILAPK